LAKTRKAFVCQNCGTAHNQWMGQCNRCNEWNTIVEEVIRPVSKGKPSSSNNTSAQLRSINDIRLDAAERIPLVDQELSRVTGGGLVPGSVLLLGGEPGIGKSTLMLQLALEFVKGPVLYVSGEESLEQVKMRAERVSKGTTEVLLLAETEVEVISDQLEKVKPGLCIVDSVQTLVSTELDSAPGTVSQIRESAFRLIQLAKHLGIPIILIGHITKEGQLAGPKVLEHMVDVVLQFEGDRNHLYRLLRAQKNRYGSTAELGIYEMSNGGLRGVEDPSQVLIGQREEMLSGVAIGLSMEGARPLLIETQALVSTAVYGTPQRSTTGFDTRRLNMLLAVLEKRCGFRLGTRDVFLNITGGLRVDDPALDLSVACAVLSSSEDMSIPLHTAFCGEVGLGGEIRPVSRIEQRLSEAAKVGYKEVYISSRSRIEKLPKGIKIHRLKQVDEALGLLFG
jgi:DNA repair protein RadA/Sms